jgi:aryl-alcohol dehydrogenase-like predicted oxidoreductase
VNKIGFMNYKNLGRSGLKVSSICLGTNNFGAQVSEQDSIKIVQRAIDSGINLIDTANMYTKGRSEEIIGKALQGHRDDVVLATKVGFNIGDGPNQGGLSRKHILSQVKQSLQKLGTDFIDIYYLHRFDIDTPLEETLRTFNDLVRDGKVRYIACSNFTAWQIAKAREVCERHDLEKFIAVQPPYNLLQRDIEKDLLPYCAQEGFGVLTYTPLMGGLLTGKYGKDLSPPLGSRAEYNPTYWERINRNQNFEILQRIKGIADEVGIPLSKLAIAWILKNPAITAPIVGASKPEQVEENSRITEINISDEVYRKLNEITKDWVSIPLYSVPAQPTRA